MRVAITGEPADDVEADEPSFRGFSASADAGDISRITLRLVEQIKNQAEQAAAARGVSLNSWVAAAVQEALSGGDPRRRHRHERRDRWKDDRGGRLRGWVEG